MPKWIEDYSGAKPDFSFTSGGEFPEDLTPYKLVVHCGGCMLNEKEMKNRVKMAADRNIPITNYGIAIAALTGIIGKVVI